MKVKFNKILDYLLNFSYHNDIEKKYYELLYAVSRKHPNETRHQTALRYIQQAEIIPTEVGQAINEKFI